MMKAARPRTDRGMTLREWGDLPDDVYAELVDGVLVEDEMTTEIHDGLVTLLAIFFGWAQRQGGFIFVERKYGVARSTGRKPDVSIFLPGTPPRARQLNGHSACGSTVA
jgi:hypothetical protein